MKGKKRRKGSVNIEEETENLATAGLYLNSLISQLTPSECCGAGAGHFAGAGDG